MRGINKIELNHATMMAAMQLWLEHEMKTPPEVTDVSWLMRGGAGDKCFILTVKEVSKGE